jgi:hypothetical protein
VASRAEQGPANDSGTAKRVLLYDGAVLIVMHHFVVRMTTNSAASELTACHCAQSEIPACMELKRYASDSYLFGCVSHYSAYSVMPPHVRGLETPVSLNGLRP